MPKTHIKKKPKSTPVEMNVEKPPPEIWVVERPQPMTALQDDVIKLSAQFVARNGRSFQTGLMIREQKNPLFGFLQTYHPHHQYFKRLVQLYTRCLLPEKGTIEKLEQTVKDKPGIIKRLMQKVYYERAQKKTEEQKKKDEEAERNAMAMIDWHDFVVVKTIEYEDDEEPTTSGVIPEVEETSKITRETEKVEDNMEIDDNVEEDELVPSNLRVRSDYVPRSQLPNYVPNPEDLKFKTPLGQNVTVGSIKEHIRSELIDPNAIEKKRMEESNEYDSSLAGGIEVSENLRKIADKRTDIFGDEELTEIGREIGEPKKKKSEKNTWDGHTGSVTNKPDTQEPPMKSNPKTGHIKPPPNMHYPPPPPGSFPGGMMPPGMIPPPGSFPPHIMNPMGPPPPGSFPPMMPRMGSGGMMPPGFPPMNLMRERPDPPEGQPPSKKQKVDGRLEPEKDWLEKHPGTLLVVVQVPNMPDKPQWNLNGQLERIQVVMSDKVTSLKEKVSEKLGGMPSNKQKLKSEIGFWKDNKTLAYYNASNGMVLELGIKERGGRKK